MKKRMGPERPLRARRPRYPMPDFIRRALLRRRLMRAYRARPPYQRNDYVGWITRAKHEETKAKRLAQMLEELAGGDRYMKMVYKARRPGSGRRS